MKIAYMTYGRPGSGKTFWCTNHKDFRGNNIINMDNLRVLCPNLKPGQRWDLAVNNLKKMIETENIVFIDNTHVSKFFWDKFYYPLKQAGFKIILVYFDTPVEICASRNFKRDRTVPKEVIYNWKVSPLDQLNYPYDEVIRGDCHGSSV